MRDSKSSVTEKAVILFFFGAIGVAITLAFVGREIGARNVRMEAVKNGHAEWVAQNDGSTVFKWKEIK